MVALVETVLLLGPLVSAAASLTSVIFSEFTTTSIVDCSASFTSFDFLIDAAATSASTVVLVAKEDTSASLDLLLWS